MRGSSSRPPRNSEPSSSSASTGTTERRFPSAPTPSGGAITSRSSRWNRPWPITTRSPCTCANNGTWDRTAPSWRSGGATAPILPCGSGSGTPISGRARSRPPPPPASTCSGNPTPSTASSRRRVTAGRRKIIARPPCGRNRVLPPFLCTGLRERLLRLPGARAAGVDGPVPRRVDGGGTGPRRLRAVTVRPPSRRGGGGRCARLGVRRPGDDGPVRLSLRDGRLRARAGLSCRSHVPKDGGGRDRDRGSSGGGGGVLQSHGAGGGMFRF
mmetsp:Transcript_5698/g.8456  ORF Transcript_5698/g.8456 Transcript_5698/m.8456 type:complete len:270 (+) Transcript_5698:76-885(+)